MVTPLPPPSLIRCLNIWLSEIKNNPAFQLEDGIGRTALLSAPDDDSDDIYLYDVNTRTNTRISTSSFGTPAGYLANNDGTSSPLSNRFPAISGNGRYVYFSSDAYGREGLSFLDSNQKSDDTTTDRDLFLRDLKSNELTEKFRLKCTLSHQ